MRRTTYVWHGAASLRRRLILEVPLLTADGAGGVETSYQKKGIFWACMVNESVPTWTQGVHMDRKELIECYRITIRWRRGITTACRFRDDNTVFKILGTADPDGRRQRLVCLVEAYLP